MSITRIFRRRAGLFSGKAPNEGTAIVEDPLLRPDDDDDDDHLVTDVEALFLERYPVIKKLLETHREQGVLVVAFDDREAAIGQAWLKASLDRTRVAVVGRHNLCNLALSPDKTSISLRHMVMLVRATSHSDVRLRVLDLHTPSGFRDEEGRVLQAMMCEGPTFLRLGDCTIMALVTDDSTPIPASAKDAYRMIPARVAFDEQRGTAGMPDRRVEEVDDDIAEATRVRSRLGPLAAAGDLCRSDEIPRGTLIIRAQGGATRRSVGDSSLERGILFGRYARCEVGVDMEDDSRLSRVHLLIVKDGDDVMAIDTASTNGTYVEERAILAEKLTDGLVLDLAEELTVTWHDA